MISTERHIFPSMGTTVEVQLQPPTSTGASVNNFAEIERVFTHLDAHFSLFRPESELSRIASGVLDLADSSAELRDLYGQSLAWRLRTGGTFTPHRPDGVIDLNGIVKAEAMRRAGQILDSAGVTSWCVSMNDDVLSCGLDPEGWPWEVSVTAPWDRSIELCSIELHGSRRAIATAGTREFTDRLWFGGTTPTSGYSQVTVVGNDVITADVLATAILVGGITSLNEAASRWAVDVFAVDHSGGTTATPGLRSVLWH